MMPATSARPAKEPSDGLGQPPAQRFRLDEIGERALAVDLDHRKRFAISRLQGGVAADVHRLELVSADPGDDLERPRAEMAAVGVVDDDAIQG